MSCSKVLCAICVVVVVMLLHAIVCECKHMEGFQARLGRKREKLVVTGQREVGPDELQARLLQGL